jgi:hypothetical protein
MGLLAGMAKTAVVAGTATATRNAVNRRQASKNVDAYQQAADQQGPAPVAASGGEDDNLAQLERLGQLKAQGILTEEEFATEKAKILSS